MNELLTKADSIADLICDSEAARQFWQARAKMEKHTQAQHLFETLKLKTNNHMGLVYSLPADHPKVVELSEQIQSIEEQLQEIPVAMQYKGAQADLNELMQGVLNLLMSRLSSNVPVEFGPRVGCGKGPDGKGCNCGGEGH